jgi:hypothetical protein
MMLLKKVLSKKSWCHCLLFAIIGIIFLPACRNQPTSNPVAVAPSSTATISLPTPAGTPTSVVSEQLTLESYTHPTNRFSLDYPTNWKFFERPDGVILLEPSGKAGYSVVFSDAGRIYNEQELNQYLVTFVAQNFAGEGSNFKPIHQETQANGSVIARFAWVDPNLGSTISELQLSQQETIVFVLHISTAEEQWESSKAGLERLISTFRPLDTSPNPEVEPTDEPPVWTLIGPESKEFGFFYASDWEILEQSENEVSVALPDSQMTFTASNFSWPHAMGDPKSAEKAALAHIETLSENYKNVQNLPPAEFPLDTETGATIDFLYTGDEGTNMAGSVITVAHSGKMYKIVFTAPAEAYEMALQWFNPMHQSFKFLSPEEFMVQEP